MRRRPLVLALLLSVAGLLVLSSAACDESGLQVLTGRLSVEPLALSFGRVPLGDAPVLDLQLRNTGRAPVTFAVGAASDGAFSHGLSGGTLQPGATQLLPVAFRPDVERLYEARLTIVSDEPSQEVDGTPVSFDVVLSGEGGGRAAVLVEPAAVDFGRVGEGREERRTVRIRSQGDAPLRIDAVSIVPAAEASTDGFAALGSTRTPLTLDAVQEGVAGGEATLTLRYAPGPASVTSAVLRLETNDSLRRVVEVPLSAAINRAPIARVAAPTLSVPGSVVTLDGSGSTDPDGDFPLALTWSLVARPDRSEAVLDPASSPGANSTTLALDRPGIYRIALQVVDAAGLAAAPRVHELVAVQGDPLEVELVWDHPVADLDLLLLREGDAVPVDDVDPPLACSWHTPRPDWGVAGRTEDDPRHEGDKLAGYGPERVRYAAPVEGAYRVAVRYRSAQSVVRPEQLPADAVVRIKVRGVVVRERAHRLLAPGEVWDAGTVTWPGGGTSTPGGAP